MNEQIIIPLILLILVGLALLVVDVALGFYWNWKALQQIKTIQVCFYHCKYFVNWDEPRLNPFCWDECLRDSELFEE